MLPRRPVTILGLLGISWLAPLAAQCLSLEARYEILRPEAADYASFGWSVARAPGLVVVGAPGDSQIARKAGAVQVLERQGDGWHRTKLVASDGGDKDRFGERVAIAGDRVLVVSPSNDGFQLNGGAVYVFRKEAGAWVQEAKLIGADIEEWDYFGDAIATQGEEVFVSSRYHGGALGDGSGAVYVFRRDGTHWEQVQKLTASDGERGDLFGNGIAVHEDVVVIAARAQWGPYDFQSGIAYVFRRDGTGWVEEAKLVPRPAPGRTGYGGYSRGVAIHGDRILVGWHDEATPAVRAGAAYVYRFDGSDWVQEARLLAPDGAREEQFGESVALWGQIALVGRSSEEAGLRNAGSIHVFRFDGEGWRHQAKLVSPEPVLNDGFDVRVQLEGGRVVSCGSGKAYVIDLFDVVPVDIEPLRDRSRIDPLSRRRIHVALLGAEGFDVRDVDRSSLRFGPAGAKALGWLGGLRFDVNRDGHADLVSRFAVNEAGIAFGDGVACLEGTRHAGLGVRGCDAIETTTRCGDGVEMALLVPPLVALAQRRRRPGASCPGEA